MSRESMAMLAGGSLIGLIALLLLNPVTSITGINDKSADVAADSASVGNAAVALQADASDSAITGSFGEATAGSVMDSVAQSDVIAEVALQSFDEPQFNTASGNAPESTVGGWRAIDAARRFQPIRLRVVRHIYGVGGELRGFVVPVWLDSNVIVEGGSVSQRAIVDVSAAPGRRSGIAFVMLHDKTRLADPPAWLATLRAEARESSTPGERYVEGTLVGWYEIQGSQAVSSSRNEALPLTELTVKIDNALQQLRPGQTE